MQCDMKVFLAANTFSERLISEVPELQAIAIIPLWSPKLDGVPTGLLRLRNETPPYIAGLLEMLGRITAFGVDVHKDMVAQLNAFDKMAGDLVMEIHTKTAELRDLNQKIEQLKSAIDNSEVSL
jgi:hypothetical protein